MAWIVLADPDFEIWYNDLDKQVKKSIAANIEALEELGPELGRPEADTLKGSKIANLKELRSRHRHEQWRVLFAFDPKRQAILLVGGSKGDDKRWYTKAIRLAEKRYERHLKAMEEPND